VYSIPSDAQYLLVDLCGGEGYGQLNHQFNAVGGLGGYVSALIPTAELKDVKSLFIYVGGWGSTGTTFNGAGQSGYGFMGGGGTDIRTMSGGTDGSANVTSRIVVAGGGGAAHVAWAGGPGGNGGGLVGGKGSATGASNCPGGSQEGPGADGSDGWANCYGAGLWQGGSCTNAKGGGGGYYGGAGCPGPGGGGSSYINPNYTILANIQGDPRCSHSGVVHIAAVQRYENSGICASCPAGLTTISTDATECGKLLYISMYLSISL